MGFIEFILGAILVFYLFGFLGKLALRLFIRRAQRNFEKQFGENGSGGAYYKQYTWGRNTNTPPQKEGDVEIQEDSAKQKKVNEKIGDYVDYEEIKE